MKFTSKNLRNFALHVFVWSVVLFSYFEVMVNTRSVYKVLEYCLIVFVNLLLFYVIANFVLPKLKSKFQNWLLIFILPLVLILGCAFKESLTLLLKWYLGYDIIHTFSFANVYRHSFSTGLFLFGSIVYALMFRWISRENKNRELQNEKTLAELRYLKSQVNPHFLFNTLNNLYYLCLKKDDIAPDMIMKLSHLMRYVVSVGEKNMVELVEEINHIKSYIELEKMRLRNPSCIVLSVDIQNTNQVVAPLLLLPFIENAFKHSRNKIDEGIEVSILENNGTLHFKIRNSFQPNPDNFRQGTGLDNVRRRLELSYFNNYQLQITNEKGSFQVDLKILLHAN